MFVDNFNDLIDNRVGRLTTGNRKINHFEYNLRKFNFKIYFKIS